MPTYNLYYNLEKQGNRTVARFHTRNHDAVVRASNDTGIQGSQDVVSLKIDNGRLYVWSVGDTPWHELEDHAPDQKTVFAPITTPESVQPTKEQKFIVILDLNNDGMRRHEVLGAKDGYEALVTLVARLLTAQKRADEPKNPDYTFAMAAAELAQGSTEWCAIVLDANGNDVPIRSPWTVRHEMSRQIEGLQAAIELARTVTSPIDDRDIMSLGPNNPLQQARDLLDWYTEKQKNLIAAHDDQKKVCDQLMAQADTDWDRPWPQNDQAAPKSSPKITLTKKVNPPANTPQP